MSLAVQGDVRNGDAGEDRLVGTNGFDVLGGGAGRHVLVGGVGTICAKEIVASFRKVRNGLREKRVMYA
jgi:hypothetical protein